MAMVMMVMVMEEDTAIRELVSFIREITVVETAVKLKAVVKTAVIKGNAVAKTTVKGGSAVAKTTVVAKKEVLAAAEFTAVITVKTVITAHHC